MRVAAGRAKLRGVWNAHPDRLRDDDQTDMDRKSTKMNFVIYVNGIVLMFFTILMTVDAAIFRDTSKEFLTAAIIVGLFGAMVTIASKTKFTALKKTQTFVLTTSVWLMAAIAGAIPLYIWNLTPVDALFEAMSGITTTGSTVMSGLDSTPKGIIFWRATLQALGGVGFIVTGIALLPILKVGGMQLFRTESSDKGEKELRNATVFASATLQIYLGLIAICALIYAIGGMNAFDAITHAMTTLSTGGYSGYDASFGHFDSAFLQWSATVFMLLGSLPFAWYIRVIYRRTFHSEQVVAMLWTLLFVIVTLTVWLSISNSIPAFDALRMVAFNVVSVVSTTGYATTDYTLWGPFAVACFFVLTAVGGSTGSTAGGAKAMRWLLAYRAVVTRLKNTYSPSRVTNIKYEGHKVEDDVMSGVIAFLVFYIGTFALLTFALAMFGLDFETASSGALTALANVGPGVGDIIGPAGNFATLSNPVKLILVFGMFLGRLEILTVFVLFTPVFWREALA
jgi:trk system potassium uptake protein TrkH